MREDKLFQETFELCKNEYRKGKITVQTLPAAVVERLRVEGFKITYNRAAHMGDVESHTIRWYY